VEPPRPLDVWLADSTPPGLLLCLWEGEAPRLAAVLPAPPLDRVTAIIGPEGGLTDAEVARIARAGGLVAGLGPRILRTDTAAPIALALLQARYGDLGGSR
jgi:16S rRNA (uracil1498-N3)-methyltransferase